MSARIEHLPRAELLLKTYLDRHVQEIIAQSERVAGKYLASKEEMQRKSGCGRKARRQLARVAFALRHARSLPPQARELIPEAQGMTTE